MKSITDHKVNGLNEAIAIETTDQPGPGGENCHYSIIGVRPNREAFCAMHLRFQDGPIQSPADFNGITNEALLAVLIDRMRGFQSGQFACRENAVALTKMEEALMWLQKRTLDRMKRGVEGTLNK